MDDDKVDLVVCLWNSARGIGTAKFPQDPKHSQNGFFFLWTDIITQGEETLHVGSMIHARLIQDPKKPDQLRAVEIEIYEPESGLD